MEFVILAVLFLGAASAFPQIIHPSDQAPQIDGRIVNGLPAAVNQFPWQVAIQVTQTGGRLVLCGGSLISNNWVLTAGHCTVGITNLQVRLGSNNFSDPAITLNTVNYLRHPAYNAATLQNNIALVMLPSSVVYTPSIQRIRLPPRSQFNANLTSQIATVSGFGRLADSSTAISNNLQYTNLVVIPNADCAAIFGPNVVTDLTVCAQGRDALSQNICNGDDGGALVHYQGQTPIQIGVISFLHGAGCSAGYPSGHVRISQYVTWISSLTGIPIDP